MALRLNLLVEKPIQEEFEYIYEEQNRSTPASLFIKGPYMMAEGVNKNNRRYLRDEMIKEVARYTEDMIKTQRAMGELNHPTTADVDLERACHMVTEFTQDGDVFYGKSKVLSTPCGQIVKCLINDGVKVGMSSRALGTLEEGKGFSTV
ncbi:primosomal protein, partial [bacterium]|nr:primosomal protein [bacterium]